MTNERLEDDLTRTGTTITEMMPSPQYTLRVRASEGDTATTWRVWSFVFEERVHAPYALRIHAIADADTVAHFDPEALLGARVVFEIRRGHAKRVVHGVVLESDLLGEGRGGPSIRLHVGPALALMGFYRRCRVFQCRTVPEIVRDVLEPRLVAQGGALEFGRLVSTYASRDYCVQYRETDLDFVLRILTDAGITLLFHHGEDAETVVLVDSNQALPPRGHEPLSVRVGDAPPSLLFVPRSEHELPVETIHTLRQRVHLEQRRVELRATSNVIGLRAGSVFGLDEPPEAGYHPVWVVTRVRHYGEAPHAAADRWDDATEYSNEIECQPHRLPIVPPRAPRPRVDGPQTAIVTGPPGEMIHCDELGRVHVRMLWDDDPHEGEGTSCWVRVAQPWAGSDFGVAFVPRVGAEVVVSFIDGDPDRPLCTGGLFNGGAMPPYALPDGRTRTVIRTRSANDDGYNELSFDDAHGAEEVYLHAQRNLREHVRAEHRTYMGGDRHSAVSGSLSASVGKDHHLTVAGDHHHTVAGDVMQHFRGACRLRVSEAPRGPTGNAGMTITVERGTFAIDAADAIVLHCGESRLELQPGQIVLTSPQILARRTSAADPTMLGAVEAIGNEQHSPD
jgi:type VI secretion system secreted protein VgrG